MRKNHRDYAEFLGRSTGTFRSSVMYGQRFGRLIVIQLAERRNERLYWHCRCDCGMEVSVLQADLKRGRVKSCGRPSCKRLVERQKPEVSYEG